MKVLLTFDLEVFFGKPSGSIAKCMSKPSRQLLQIASKFDVKMTFFWDVGHLLAIRRLKKKYPVLEKQENEIVKLIKEIVDKGHGVQLHVHPHWEKADWNGRGWEMNIKGNYKLSDFEEKERASIFKNTIPNWRK